MDALKELAELKRRLAPVREKYIAGIADSLAERGATRAECEAAATFMADTLIEEITAKHYPEFTDEQRREVLKS